MFCFQLSLSVASCISYRTLSWFTLFQVAFANTDNYQIKKLCFLCIYSSEFFNLYISLVALLGYLIEMKQNKLLRQVRKAMDEHSRLNIKLELQLFAQQITDSPIYVSCGLFKFNLGLFGSVSI